MLRASALKVPHMGWNEVRQHRDHPLWAGIPDMSRFYFVHSYYVHAEDRSLLAGSVEYGVTADAALGPATTCSPCSFTRKKAPLPGSPC
jgi:imidazoleglycerol phosphate synthase glutamine amidotransferase subunit HisH